MRYREIPPPPALKGVLRCLWLVEDEPGGGEPERVLPDGCMELVVHYRSPMRRLVDGGREVQARALVAGQLRSATLLEASGALGMVAARFEPWAAGPILRESLGALTGRTPSLSELWGREGEELEDRIREAATDEARFALLARAILARFGRRPSAVEGLREASAWIDRSRGTLPVAELARHLGWSRRRLERRFEQFVGLSPKTLCRIRRFQAVVQALPRLSSGHVGGLSTLALDTGHADQPHMAREFKELAGLGIRAWLAERHALSDSLTSVADEEDARSAEVLA